LQDGRAERVHGVRGTLPYVLTMQGNLDGQGSSETNPRTSQVRRESRDAFLSLPLVVHSVLADVPLRDVTVVDLPNGGAGRTVGDVWKLLPGGVQVRANLPTRALFAIRRFLGRALRWDTQASSTLDGSYRDRVDPAVLRRSRPPGDARVRSFETLYELDNELLIEARNATVHAFMSVALVPVVPLAPSALQVPTPGSGESGYRLYWAVYVKPVSRFTSLYMAVIEPFRRFIVYPSLLGGVRRAWAERYSLPA
jgi:hypothetical protein